MKYYNHHIRDFNNATRHLTRVERSLYRDLIELYYETEAPLKTDLTQLARLVMARSEEEKTALEYVLDEFFEKREDGFHNDRCDKNLEGFQQLIEKKRQAGKASAARRKLNSTGAKQVLNTSATTQYPIPNTKEKDLSNDKSSTSGKPDSNGRAFKFDDSHMKVANRIYTGVKRVYPAAKTPNFKSWANTVRLISEVDGHPVDDILRLFEWANKHEFWATNIMSPDKLRKQWDTLAAKKLQETQGHHMRPAWSQIPRDDNKLAEFATTHGHPPPISGESFIQYRNRLRDYIEEKLKNG